MPKILIADDHAVARRGIKEIILDGFPAADIRTVNSAEELVIEVLKQPWDLIISDITMPGRSTLDVLQEIKKGFPDLPVLILSIHPVEDYAVRVIRAGAAGYLNKDDAIEEELLKAVNTILRGRKYITPSVAERLAKEIAEESEKEPHELLSDREFEVFKLLARGKSTSEIAEELHLSSNTIGTFRSRILTKMDIKNNAELVAYAIRNKLI